jgi:hypothetical protein
MSKIVRYSIAQITSFLTEPVDLIEPIEIESDRHKPEINFTPSPDRAERMQKGEEVGEQINSSAITFIKYGLIAVTAMFLGSVLSQCTKAPTQTSAPMPIINNIVQQPPHKSTCIGIVIGGCDQ